MTVVEKLYVTFTCRLRRSGLFMFLLGGMVFALSYAMAPASAQASADAEHDDYPMSLSLSGNYLAGRFASSERDADRAAGFYARALMSDPDNLDILEPAFLLEVSAGNMLRAVQLANKVIKLGRDNRMAFYISGLDNFLSKRFSRSTEKFDRAARGQIGILTSGLLNAWAYKGVGDLDAALKALVPLSKTQSFIIFRTYHSALIADALGSNAKALEFYQSAYRGTGSSLRITLAYGNFLERRNKQKQAVEIYDAFLSRVPGHPLVTEARDRAIKGTIPPYFARTAKNGAAEAMFGVASALSQDSSSDLALIYTQIALYLNPTSSSAWTLLGDIYEDMKKNGLALTSYDQVAEKSSLRKNAEIRIAANLDRLDRTDDAVEKLKSVIAAYPEDFSPMLALGNMMRGRSKFKEAIEAYSSALELMVPAITPQWSFYYFRGISYERTDQWEKAEVDLLKALELEPNQPLVLNYLGYSWVDKNLNLQRALKMIRKAVKLRPADGYIVDSLGWAQYRLNDFENAVITLERAVNLKPDDPIINDHLGDAYWRVGRKLEARFQWQHALDLKAEPENQIKIKLKLKNGLEDVEPETTDTKEASQPAGNKT